MRGKVAAYTLLLVLIVGVLPLVSGSRPFIGPTEEAKATIIESAGVDADQPDSPLTGLKVSSSGPRFAFVKIDLSEMPPIDEIFIVSAYLSFHIDSWSGRGPGGYAGVATHHCEDDSWSSSTLTWNSKPEHREKSTDTWGFAIIHWGATLGFTIEEDVEETLRSGDTILTEVVTWGAGTGNTALSSPKLRITYVKRPVYKVFFDAVCDVPDINITETELVEVEVSDTHPELHGESYARPGNYDLEFQGRCKFLGWQPSGGVSVSNPDLLSTQLTIDSAGQLIAACSLDWVLYGAKGDKPSSTYAGVKFNASEKYASAFTPVVSGYLRLFRIYILKDVAPFELHFMGMTDDPKEKPPVDIANPIRITPTSTGWLELDLTSQRVEVKRDVKFYLSITWLEDEAPSFGKSSGLEDLYKFTNNTWDSHYEDILLQLIVSRSLEEPVEFLITTTTTTTTTEPSPTTPPTPTTTKETTVGTTTPPETTKTTTSPTTTIETTPSPRTTTTPVETTVSPPRTTTETTTTRTATPEGEAWGMMLLGFIVFLFFIAGVAMVARAIIRRIRRPPRLGPEAPPPSPPAI